MPDETDKPRDVCAKCGKGELRLVAGRVTQEKPGYANLFQCMVCGNLEFRDMPPRPNDQKT